MQTNENEVAETPTPIVRYLDVIVAIIGVVLALIRAVGYLFFASSLSFSVFIPAVVVGMLSIIPLPSLRENRWLVVGLLGLYIVSYLLGGLERLIRNETVMPDALEFIVIAYSSFRAFRSSHSDS
jgi:hypothetical protein